MGGFVGLIKNKNNKINLKTQIIKILKSVLHANMPTHRSNSLSSKVKQVGLKRLHLNQHIFNQLVDDVKLWAEWVVC